MSLGDSILYELSLPCVIIGRLRAIYSIFLACLPGGGLVLLACCSRRSRRSFRCCACCRCRVGLGLVRALEGPVDPVLGFRVSGSGSDLIQPRRW